MYSGSTVWILEVLGTSVTVSWALCDCCINVPVFDVTLVFFNVYSFLGSILKQTHKQSMHTIFKHWKQNSVCQSPIFGSHSVSLCMDIYKFSCFFVILFICVPFVGFWIWLAQQRVYVCLFGCVYDTHIYVYGALWHCHCVRVNKCVLLPLWLLYSRLHTLFVLEYFWKCDA